MDFQTIRKVVADEWCSWTHGGGTILRDPAGRVNWQCLKCGRWSDPVSEADEAAALRAAMKEAPDA